MKLRLPTSLLVLGMVVSVYGMTSTPVPSPTPTPSAPETTRKTLPSTTVSENTTVNSETNPTPTTGETNPTPTTGKQETTTDNSTAVSNVMTSTVSSDTTASATAGGSSPTSPGNNVTNSTVVTPSSPTTEEHHSSTTSSQVTSTPAAATIPTPTTTPTAPSTPASSSTPATSSTPVAVNVVISETNFLLASEPFVELRGTPDSSLLGLTAAVFNGTSGAEAWSRDFDSSGSISSGGIFSFQPDDAEKVQSLTSVVLALYETKNYSKSLKDEGLVDFAVFSTDPDATIASDVKEIMLPGDEPVTIVKKKLASSQNLSLSRCGEAKRSASMFVLAAESRGQDNHCSMTPNRTTWTLQLHPKGGNCIAPGVNDSLEQEVKNRLVEEINRRCECALTTWLVHGNLSCVRDLFLDFVIKESYKSQGKDVISAFISFTNDNSSLTVGNKEYSVVNCTSSCRAVPPIAKHGKANTSVTVAVVLSCVAVFLIILVSVILYMRGKRRGIIRQFRMTRLQEDDDMDDMDNFIGSGGEPSFSARSSR